MISATAGFGQRRGAAAAWGGVVASLSVLPGRLVGVPVITAVLGDITKQEVDAIVNAANKAMRGGGGVDGAIHRNGGPAILHDCIERFPKGLATDDTGWTTASDLPAQWVIHTVGPNYNAAQRDRSLLTSCYRRALEVADELSAQSVAFPLISTGASGWPRHDVIAAAIETLVAADTRVEDVRLVAFDPTAHTDIRAHLASPTPIRILQGIRVLHQRGYHRVRPRPGLGGAGMWRVTITAADDLNDSIGYSIGALTEFASGKVNITTSPETVADLILNALPEAAPTADDPEYVSWFADLMQLVESTGRPPISYDDYSDHRDGWEVGPASRIRHPHPPAPPKGTSDTTMDNSNHR